MAHTPGPWYVGDDPVVIQSDNAGNDIGFVAMTLPDSDLCWNGTQENYDNARLIAAAPELLDALKSIACDAALTIEGARIIARDAIRKAEGGAE